MNKRLVLVGGVVLSGILAFNAFAQPGGGRGFGQMREARVKAVAALQEQVGKLKAMMEQQPAARGNFQDMTDEERTKMREEMTKRQEEQNAIMAEIQKQLDTIKGGMQVARDHRQALEPLNELLASAKSENATATATKIQRMIEERQKEFQDKMTAMGMDPEMVQRMMERGGQRRGQ